MLIFLNISNLIFASSSYRPVPKMKVDLIEKRMQESGRLAAGQHLTEDEIRQICSKPQQQPADHEPIRQETQHKEGLWTASGEFVPPEKVQAYLDKMKGYYPQRSEQPH